MDKCRMGYFIFIVFLDWPMTSIFYLRQILLQEHAGRLELLNGLSLSGTILTKSWCSKISDALIVLHREIGFGTCSACSRAGVSCQIFRPPGSKRLLSCKKLIETCFHYCFFLWLQIKFVLIQVVSLSFFTLLTFDRFDFGSDITSIHWGTLQRVQWYLEGPSYVGRCIICSMAVALT